MGAVPDSTGSDGQAGAAKRTRHVQGRRPDHRRLLPAGPAAVPSPVHPAEPSWCAGANAVGYTTYADNVCRQFAKEAVSAGMDIFRVFDRFRSRALPGCTLTARCVTPRGLISLGPSGHVRTCVSITCFRLVPADG